MAAVSKPAGAASATQGCHEAVTDGNSRIGQAFWVPCNSANFFHRSDGWFLGENWQAASWQPVLAEHGRVDDDAECALDPSSYEFVVDVRTPPSPSSSVMRRTLIMALSVLGSPEWRPLRRVADAEYPEAIAVTGVRESCQVTLVVTAAGLYHWTIEGRSVDHARATLDLLYAAALGLEKLELEIGSGQDQWVHPDDYDGLFGFFQLNALLGGLFYPGFRPGVFFESPFHLLEDAVVTAEVRSVYLDRVVKALVVTADPIAFCDGGILEQGSLERSTRKALSKFLSVTREQSLMRLKWRVERARRHLLGEMLGALHRRHHLVQLREALNPVEDFQDASADQVRGYVMMVSSKLPLVASLGTFLTDALDTCKAGAEDELRSSLKQWERLVGDIEANIGGLERAIENAWMEATLYEQEQMRAEQEALAEIERARNREQVLTTTVDSIFGAAVLVFTIAAFSLTGDEQRANVLEHIEYLLGALLIALGLWAGFRWIRLRRSRARQSQRHYYELNIRLDAHVGQAMIASLMQLDDEAVRPEKGPIALDSVNGWIKARVSRERGSYRVERLDEDESLFKIHVETVFVLRRSGLVAMLARPERLSMFAVYEFRSHPPAGAGKWILHEVRVSMQTNRSFPSRDLQGWTETVVWDCIDRYLPVEERLFEPARTYAGGPRELIMTELGRRSPEALIAPFAEVRDLRRGSPSSGA
jgi:hypothetical protein